MTAYQRYITVVKPDELVISGLPLRTGQRVRVTVEVEDPGDRGPDAELRSLLKDTQALPQAQTVTEDEIAAQIAAARGRGT